MLQRVIRSTGAVPTFARFTAVACAISLIDAGGLYALHEGVDVNVYLARLFSYLAAITAGYFLNSRFTFPGRTGHRGMAAQLLRFYGVHGTGGLINYGVFLLTLLVGRELAVGMGVVFWLPLLGVWLGGVAGMCFNFLFSSRMVFERRW